LHLAAEHAKEKGVTGEVKAEEKKAEESGPFDGSKVKPIELTRDEIRKLLATPGDRYKDVGLQKTEVKGERRHSGDPIMGYPYSPHHFEKSHATGRGIRHYVKLPDGQIVHPDELRDAINRGRITIKATDAEKEAAERFKDWREAIKADHLHTRQQLVDKAIAAKVPVGERSQIEREHKSRVAAAISRGEYVPAEVLADYPDLAAKQGVTGEVKAEEKPKAEKKDSFEDFAQTMPGVPRSKAHGLWRAKKIEDAEAGNVDQEFFKEHPSARPEWMTNDPAAIDSIFSYHGHAHLSSEYQRLKDEAVEAAKSAGRGPRHLRGPKEDAALQMLKDAEKINPENLDADQERMKQIRREGAVLRHKRSVREALAAGKPVPAEVLADYPDLKPKEGNSRAAEPTN
jgi:uncharacterized protein (DUF433 family)